MQDVLALARWRAPFGLWPLAVSLAVAVPLGLIAFFLVSPLAGVRLDDAVQHFAVTSNVSVIAAVVSVAVVRPALAMAHWPSILVALGFLSLAGFFLLHGLATPGVLLKGDRAAAGASVIAVAAQLSMLVPALFFAARYSPLPSLLERARGLTPRRVLLATAATIGLFDVMALVGPLDLAPVVRGVTGYGGAAYAGGSYVDAYYGAADGSASYGAADPGASYGPVYGGVAGGDPLWAYAAAVATVALLLYAAYRQSGQFARSRRPTDAALCISFLFLAEAQVAAALGPVFSLTFWGYHGLMAAASALAIGALFVELDRRRGLERFLPPNVVESVIVGDRLSLAGERRTATIMFTDLRGSTALAEHSTPETAVATVNTYLRSMARAVLDEGAILDKFTGDGVMAIFGVTSDAASGVAAAARAARRIRSEMARLNAERRKRGEPAVGYGVGFATGPVVLGAVGLPERSEYTAMGDTVNTAARMEALTKYLAADVIVSESVTAYLPPDAADPLDETIVRGKSEPVKVFALR